MEQNDTDLWGVIRNTLMDIFEVNHYRNLFSSNRFLYLSNGVFGLVYRGIMYSQVFYVSC